jgi:hypothetical protein
LLGIFSIVFCDLQFIAKIKMNNIILAFLKHMIYLI